MDRDWVNAARHGDRYESGFHAAGCVPQGIAAAIVSEEDGGSIVPASRVAIYTLGRFSVVVDQQPLAFSKKTPKKPLELLKALIALGGRAIDIEDLMSVVWPEQGLAARATFDVALMRLRRLLMCADALTLSGGKLTLNESVCWVDIWTFERDLARWGRAASDSIARKALTMYRGRFLDRDRDARWIVPVRDRLAAKYRRAVLEQARAQEQTQRFDVAAQIYRRALEHDNLAEELYYRLMHCERLLGRRAEAIEAYRRCRHLLSVTLGSMPSVELQTLHHQIVTERARQFTGESEFVAIA